MSILDKSIVHAPGLDPVSPQIDDSVVNHALVRERLHDLLDEPATVVFVTAAAGFGKTTMLATWANRRSPAIGWLSLSPNDNDPGRLGEHLANALGTEATRAGPRLLRPGELSGLVLDNSHVLTDSRCITLLDNAIPNLPPMTKLIVSGRSPLPFRLARLRSLGRVRDIIGNDLRLTLPEAYALLGSHLSDDGESRELIRTLWSITLGWPAGLALAANVGLARTSFPPGRTAFDWAAWDQALDDYFEEEVIAPLPEHLQDALFSTADLPFLSVETCGHDLGGEATPGLLALLASQSGFLEESQTHSGRFYHNPLFASVLRRLASRRSPAPRKDRRALVAALLESNELEAAADLALQTTDPDLIECVFQAFGKWLADRSMFHGMRLWLGQVPARVMERNPDLQYWLMLGNMGSARTNENSIPFGAFQEFLEASDHPRDRGRLALLRGMFAHFRGNDTEAVAQLTRALELLPQTNLVERMYAATVLNKRSMLEGRDDEALTARDLAIRISRQLPRDERWVNRVIDPDRADMYAVRGDLNSAITMYRIILGRSTGHDPDLVVAIRGRLIAIYLELARLDEATAELAHIDALLELDLLKPHHDPSGASTRLLLADRERGHVIGWRRYAALARIRVMLAAGDGDAVGEWAHQYIGQTRQLPERDLILLHLAYRWLERGELSLVDDLLSDDRSEVVPWSMVFGDVNPGILAIDLHLTRREYGDAATQARSLAERSALTRRRPDQIGALMRLAAASHELHDDTVAHDSLGKALEIANAGGFVRSLEIPVYDLQPLLQRAWDHSRTVRDRLARRPHLFTPPATEKAEISRRELEILRLVANGRTNQQIADTLFLSPNTVRNHLTHITRRLDAQSRTEAVAIARARGLLD